jgi:hypothetical protein
MNFEANSCEIRSIVKAYGYFVINTAKQVGCSYMNNSAGASTLKFLKPQKKAMKYNIV